MTAARFCDSTSLAAASPVRLVWPTTRRQPSRDADLRRDLLQPDRVLRLQVGRLQQASSCPG